MNSNIHFPNKSHFFKYDQPVEQYDRNDIMHFNTNSDVDYFRVLLELSTDYSTTHTNFLNLKSTLIMGDGFKSFDNATMEFLENINSYENSYELLEKISQDFSIFEAFAMQVIYNENGTYIAELHYIDVSKLRAKRMRGSEMTVTGFYYKDDWEDRQEKAKFYNAYNPDNITSPIQIIYVKNYTAGNKYYCIPSYSSALNSIELDRELNVFALNSVKNGFNPSGLLWVKRDLTAEDQTVYVRDFNKSYTGSENANRLMLFFGTEDQAGVEFIPITNDDISEKYKSIREDAMKNIAIAHRGNTDLIGIADKGSDLGGDANKLITSIEYYKNTVTNNFQDKVISAFRKVLKFNNLDTELVIQNKPILQLLISAINVDAIMERNEKRNLFGLEEIDENAELSTNNDLNVVEGTESENNTENNGI